MFDGIRAQHGAPPLETEQASRALHMVYAFVVRNMDSEKADELDGWMTCTLEQAVDFIGVDREREQEDRLVAARIAGVVG